MASRALCTRGHAGVAGGCGTRSRAVSDPGSDSPDRTKGAWCLRRFLLSLPLQKPRVRYQVNATVLIPLLVTSIPLVTRELVGFGSAAARDFRAEDGGWLRTYEFFAVSIPEQARGMNRMGFLREAVRVGADGNQWTAHFGVISSKWEETRNEAERNLDRDEERSAVQHSGRFHGPRSDLEHIRTARPRREMGTF